MICPNIEEPRFFLFSNQTSSLIYYSHLLSLLVTFLMGLFVLIKNKKELLSKIFFILSFSFSCWVFFNLIQWTNNNGGIIMFFWSLLGIFYCLVAFFSFWFFYAFVYNKNLNFWIKFIWFLFLLPVFIFSATEYNLKEFDVTVCGVFNEGFYYTSYYYAVGFFTIFLILFLSILEYRKANKDFKKQIFVLTLGIEMFLFLFFVVGFLASYLVNKGIMYDFSLDQYSLFGVPVFLGVLAYLIVKHQLFGIKLITTQVLTSVIVILIGAQFAFIRNPINRWLNGITFVLSLVFGWILVRSVKKEIKTREEMELISEKLANAYAKLKKLDNAKTEFLSIASHQLRTPLTSIKGYVSMMMTGDFGKVPKGFIEPLEKVYISNERLIKLVEDLLNISRIETGRLIFAFQPNEIGKVAQEVFDTMTVIAKEKGLKLDYEAPKKPIASFLFDANKIREVFSNLVDNSLKYTKQGWIKIRLEETGDNKVLFSVSDSGMGIAKNELRYIFEKFQRGQEAGTMQSEGTGLGLYVCQKIIQAHRGKIWVESEGPGKGSQFYVELDKNFVPVEKE